MATKTPQVGEQAPDFELPGTDGPFKLSEHRGERVVLLFYPGDNTMVCTKQFCSYRDRADDFATLDATVVGISSQDLASHEGFIAKHGLNVPLLSDVDRQVSISYSAFSPRLGIKRAVIVIDEQGIVRARHDHLLGLDYQSVDELKAMLDALPSPAPEARYLGVSEPTVRLWVRRDALAALPGFKPALIEHESLRRVGRAVRELRARGEDREWLEGVVRYVEDMTDRSSPSVRQGLKELAEGKLQPA